MAHRGHGPGAHIPAVHDGRIELGCAVAGERRTAPGIEERIVFENPYRGRDRIETAAAALEHREALIERGREPGAEELLTLGRQTRARHRSGAAVNGDGVHLGRCRPGRSPGRCWSSG